MSSATRGRKTCATFPKRTTHHGTSCFQGSPFYIGQLRARFSDASDNDKKHFLPRHDFFSFFPGQGGGGWGRWVDGSEREQKQGRAQRCATLAVRAPQNDRNCFQGFLSQGFPTPPKMTQKSVSAPVRRFFLLRISATRKRELCAAFPDKAPLNGTR